MGKAYKPDVDYCDGSYSLLIGHYLEELQAKFFYVDPLTGDIPPFEDVPVIVFLAHNRTITYGYTGSNFDQEFYCKVAQGSVIIDPWRCYPLSNNNYEVIHYGNTRMV
jgi:hypothetical protein